VPALHPHWATRAPIYQVNLRQFTPEGTLAAFEPHLPRIARMLGGQGILWFMPLQPIGEANRKGTLGSYYSVRDYTAVNPEFGTLNDFNRVVEKANALGLRVIIDWVANHTAWDHPWTREHPEWYRQDEHGRIHSYVYRATPEAQPEHWTDVVGLDWSKPPVWSAMEQAMLWWMHKTRIDGFRCDVAALVPIEFWERMRPRLAVLREVFLLAEAHEPIHHRAAFDATYDWGLLDVFKRIAKGQGDASDLHEWWRVRGGQYGADDYRMLYTANHDSNSWQGSCAEHFGSVEAFKAFATLAMLLPGQPLIYGGQEAWLEKRLAFFEKDTIDWRDRPLEGFYGELLALKRRHPALGNGHTGTHVQWLDTGNPAVVGFERRAGGAVLRVAVNLSPGEQACRLGAARGSSLSVCLAPWSRSVEA
jgi:glycosidase